MDYSIIKGLLDERNMTFKELSDMLNVDRNNLYNSLTKGNPTLQRLEAVAKVLDVHKPEVVKKIEPLLKRAFIFLEDGVITEEGVVD